MKRNIVLAAISFALAGSASAQPPAAGMDWLQPATGADGTSPQQVDIIKTISDIAGKPPSAITEEDLIRYWEQHQASHSHRPLADWMLTQPVAVDSIVTSADTPLPPETAPTLPESKPAAIAAE